MQNKIFSPLSLETLFKLTKDLKDCGEKVGFTHGTFDLLHQGHLFLLTQASINCDFLIVLVESDDNVRNYKNGYKPVIEQNERLNSVNSLAFVGNAFINNYIISDDWYNYLYKELHIDFLAIGRNFYAEEAVKESTTKLGIGLYKYEFGTQSTTRIINKIKRKY